MLIDTAAAAPAEITGPASQPVRVAVAQFAYHPAVRGSLLDPYGKFDPEGKLPLSTLPAGGAAAPDALREAHRSLSERIEAAYVEQLVRKVRGVILACRAWDVRLLVLPEYSLPVTALQAIAEAAGEMVVVAGSCFVDTQVRKSTAYEVLHSTARPGLRQNVAHVLHASTIVALVAKLQATGIEKGLEMRPGTAWSPVPMPGYFGGPLGVLICLDFLERTAAPYREIVAPKLDQCRALAVPALSSEGSQRLFEGHYFEESGPGRRPVFFANHAPGGGSTIVAGERTLEELRAFPVHAGVLERGEEGVLVADVDLAVVGVGKGGRYGEALPIKPFASASLVYAGANPEVVLWLRDLRDLLPDVVTDEDEADVLERAAEWIGANPPPRRGASPAQTRRWDRLLQGIEDETSVDSLRRLTREVVLEPDILPLGALERALARGAGKAIQSWVLGGLPGAAPFATIGERLADPSEAAPPPTWADGARKVWAQTVDKVQGRTGPAPRSVVSPLDRATETVENEVVQKSLEEGNAHMLAGRFAAARTSFERAMEESRRQGEDNTLHAAKWSLWFARGAIGAATCAVNLQDMDAARAILEKISIEVLDTSRRVRVANVWAALGDVERARAVLPAAHLLTSDEDARDARIALQRIELAEGRVPAYDSLEESPDILLPAAFLLLEKQDAARAARLARRALGLKSDNPLIRVEALRVWILAILQTVHEQSDALVPVPRIERAEIVQQIEAGIGAALEFERASRMSLGLARAWKDFLRFTSDTDALSLLGKTSADDPKEEEETASTAVLQTAQRLAHEGHLEAAFQSLPPDNHPWRAPLLRIDVLKSAGQYARALPDALALAEAFPGRARIEMTLSDLLAADNRHEEALLHAQRAMEALPARGLRLLVAQRLLTLRRGEEAWEMLLREEGAAGPRILRALAIAADQAHPERALEVWQKYVAIRPADAEARVQVAVLLFVNHKPFDAAQEAWSTFEAHADALTVEHLHRLGTLQGDPLSKAERERRVKAISACLHRRFPGDPTAEHARMSLLAEIGALDDRAERIDFALLREAGVARAMTTAQLIEMMQAHGQMSQMVQQLGRQGALPIALFCAAVTPPVAVPLVVVRLLHRDRVGVAFSAPVDLEDFRPGLLAEGAHLLVSQVELYLLAALGLLDCLKERLGATGRISMFRQAWLSVVDDHGLLRAQAEAERAERLDRTVAALAPLPRLVPAPDEVGMPDVKLAVLRGGMVLATRPDPELCAAGNLVEIPEERRISPRTVLGWLAARGSLSAPDVQEIEPYFASDPETPAPVPTPSLLLVSAFFLEKLHAHGALADLQDLFPGVRVYVGEADWKALLYRQNAAIEERRASHLAEQVHGWIALGMSQDLVQILPDPQVEGLPSLLDPGDDVAKRLLREPLEWAVSYADALAEHPDWWRLSADFFGSTIPFSADTVAHLRWKDPIGEPRALVHRLRIANRRLVSLPGLIRALLAEGPQEAERHQALWKLAQLGLTDALGPGELLALFRHYSGLEGAAPRRTLDGLEWMARERGHVGGDAARLRVAVAYAAAVFQAFCGKPTSGTEQDSAGPSKPETAALSWEDAESVGRALLGRAEVLGQDTKTDFLDVVLRLVAASAASRPRLAWEPDASNTGSVRRLDGPLTGLWRFVREWTGTEGARRAAFERGLREVWLLLDDGDEEQRVVVSSTILDATQGRHVPGEVLLTDLAIEAEAILSANWEWRPTTIQGVTFSGPPPMETLRFTNEHLLDFGAQPETSLATDAQGRSVLYTLPLPKSGGAIGVVAPVEAILLRRTGDALSQLAQDTMRLQGVHDGRAYRLLKGLARHPSRVSLRRAVARGAVSALWRAVRDDPTYLVRWPTSRGIGLRGARPSLRELRAILSEPPDLGPNGMLVGRGVLHRAFGENGIWHHREDKGDLLKMAFEVPGELIFGPLELMLHNEYEGHVEEALAIVTQSDSHPVARVARSVVLLRAGAARRPLIRLPSGEDVDLRERLLNVLQRLLERSSAKPPQDSFAAAEPFLLRVCGQVILDLAGPAPLPIREGLWLTYRLFQWLCAQLDAMSPDARIAGMRRLIALAPLPSKPVDRLDPRGFGLERTDLFDHRLGTILFALATMEAPELLLGDQPRPEKMPLRLAWLPAMLDILADLASRIEDSPGLRSELGWSAPDTIGDLAHLALLRIDPNAFLRVPAEARLARLRRLPEVPESSGTGIQAFFDTLIIQTGLHAASLPEEERAVLLARVLALPPGNVGDRWRMLTLPSLFANGSSDVTEAEATLAVQGRIAEPLAPMALSLLLLGVLARDPARIGPVFEEVLKEAERRNVDPVPFAAGLARVTLFAPEPMREVVAGLLRAMATRPPFQGDDRMRELLAALESA